jgi:hypothetical protein
VIDSTGWRQQTSLLDLNLPGIRLEAFKGERITGDIGRRGDLAEAIGDNPRDAF